MDFMIPIPCLFGSFVGNLWKTKMEKIDEMLPHLWILKDFKIQVKFNSMFSVI